MSQVIFEVSDDKFFTEGTLQDFKECVWGEEDCYEVKDNCLYYKGTLIGTPKGDTK